MLRIPTGRTGGVDGAPPIDPDEARRTADEILRDGAYAEPAQSLLDRALEWLFDRLGSAFGTLPGGGPGSGIAWLFVAVLVVVALWLVVRALRAPRTKGSDDSAGVEYGTETERDARVWLAEAARLAGDGDHRGALRCRHQALVARLITDGTAVDVPGGTAGEYATQASRALPDHTDRVHRLTRAFDDAWYGGLAVGADGYRSFADDCEVVEESSARRSAEAVST